MTGRTFVDSNVLVYARDTRDRAKQARAADWLAMLWRARTGRIGIQVLSEYYVTVTRKLRPGLSADEAWDDVRLLMSWRPQPLDEQLLEHGRDIERRFRLSWWDSLVVAAAQLQDCSTLLSEDFQNGMEFDTVVVSNPFALKAGESGPPYNVAETAIPRHRPRGRPKRRE
ncbi:MAG: PIN domain-containing protein [Betaproteobacteria bacterium]|nr:MAG: PIN domain-containing protein [Betaproteobacteria bacterium]TMH67610.1 MAG: PIN domain-containing protein [Betaproteobacteria bacterium]